MRSLEISNEGAVREPDYARWCVSDTPQVLLAYHLKALKLPTFLREYDKVAPQCAAAPTGSSTAMWA